MIDREKVINELVSHIENALSVDSDYVDCIPTDLLQYAVALLKAEKKTKVVFKQYDGSIESECGNCGLYLDKAYSRCPKCNKELDWNGG